MSNTIIYHNPDCGTSRNTLAMIRNSGIEPTIIYYLDTPPSREELVGLIAAMGITVRALLRKNVEPYAQLGLDDETLSDERLIESMLQQPILINRPIVVTPLGTRLCRPSEVVLEILTQAQKQPFRKEDGGMGRGDFRPAAAIRYPARQTPLQPGRKNGWRAAHPQKRG
ncbi:Arsenate reductase [Raoultella ornithinolytica]|nr:Arsenate reductase [Raoultella ornithinolytica]